MPSLSFARNKDQSNRHRAAGPSSCADRMAAGQARFCSLRRSPSDPSAPAPKRRRTAPDGPPARNRPPPPATVVSDQLSKDENVCSSLNGIRFVPKMPPLLGHAPRSGSFQRQTVPIGLLDTPSRLSDHPAKPVRRGDRCRRVASRSWARPIRREVPDNKIDADLLPRLTVDDLKDIGVSVVGDRRRLLDAIALIAGASRPADLPASPRKSAPSNRPLKAKTS